MSALTGRCACGAVTWAYDGAVIRKLACHCGDCQKACSSGFTAFVGLRPDTVKWTGEINHFKSSAETFRGFCPGCGTRLYFRSNKWPGEIHIHAATLDDGTSYRPDCHVVTASSPGWLRLGDDLPRHGGFQAAPKGG